jgi:UDP-N-acetylglucosamine acyltransferase
MSYHSLAAVDTRAQIGKNVVIEPFAVVEGDVVIGDNCWIGSGAVIKNGTRLGNNCQIYHGAVLGADPQDLKYKGEYTLLEVGDHTIVREYATLNRGTGENGLTKVGAHCLLMAYVHVAHDCIVADRCILANNVTLAGHIEVGEHAVIGGMSAVHQFVKIGQHTMISGGSLVHKDVPPYIRAANEPMSYIGINSIGLGRRGFTTEQITTIQDIYRILYVFNQNVTRGLAQIYRETTDSPERATILDFIENQSTRGIIRGLRGRDKDE